MVNVTYLWLYSLKHTLNIQFNVAPTVRQSKNLNNAIITETELDTTVVKKRKIGGGGRGAVISLQKGWAGTLAIVTRILPNFECYNRYYLIPLVVNFSFVVTI